MNLGFKLLDAVVERLLSDKQRERLGRHLLNVVRGEGNSDPVTNGEYALLNSLKAIWRERRVSPVIFDVGANVGEWSTRTLVDLPQSSRLYAFEPDPNAFALLSTRSNIDAMNFALGDEEASAPFYGAVTAGVAETNSLHKRRTNAHGLSQSLITEVAVKRGDQVARSLGIHRIDYLKIDTEGHELAVLNGFSEMLGERRIDYVQFEYGGTWADSRTLLVDAFDLLVPSGYYMAKIYPSGLQFFREYDQRQETFTFANFLAMRQGLANRDAIRFYPAVVPFSALA
jgi:FkbM family methyltransferase